MTRADGLMVPTVHADGTPFSVLLHETGAALDTLRAASASLRAHPPREVDYRPHQGEAAYRSAVAQHAGRLRRLDDVIGELSSLYLAIHDQGASR